MERIVVAFSNEEAQRRILRLLESAGCSPAACGASGGDAIRTVRSWAAPWWSAASSSGT